MPHFGCAAALVTKCMTAAHNLKMREKAMSGTSPPEDRIVAMILNVGTFRSTDINFTNEWHSVAKLVKGARSLVAWAKSVALDDPAAQEERDQIVDIVVSMDMRASINTGGQSVEFAELVRFGDEGWLRDQCIVCTATRIAVEASWNPPPTIHIVNPTLASFKDDKQRTRSIDTKKCSFSKCHDELTILCPIYVDVSYRGWCGAIFDFKRRVVRIYDPFHKKELDEVVESLVKDVFLPLVRPDYQMEIRACRAWLQRDGFSCGVYVAHWFDYYISTYVLSEETAVSTETEPLSSSDLEMIRYKLFCYVLYGLDVNLAK